MRILLTFLVTLFLVGCSADPVRIGSKDQVENRILAEMFAQLLEEKGVEVKRVRGLGTTQAVFEALKSEDIDLYPEYSGTALAMLGAPRLRDADEGFAVASESLAPSGLTLLDRLGFASNYVVLARPSLAASKGLKAISDLTRTASDLRLGVTRSFAARPRDGLESFVERFGLDFDQVTVVGAGSSGSLYDALLEKRVDVVVGVSTDPEISDYGLVTLEDTSAFFPAYEAAPLVSQAALDRVPEIADTLAQLAGKIDDQKMRDLNAAVIFDGRPVSRVAKRALHELGLVASLPRERVPVFDIAVEPEALNSDDVVDTLRAVRRALRGREVDLLANAAPVEAVQTGNARLAVAPAVASFAVKDGATVRSDRVEAVAAVGSTFLHALSLSQEPVTPAQASVIAAGPVGSASYNLARAIADSGTGNVTVVALDDNSAISAAKALQNGEAQVALVFSQLGRSDLRVVLADASDITLVSANEWWESSARLSMPVMREAQINAGIYESVGSNVETLSTQLVLFGPAATPEQYAMGQQGPSTFFNEQRPLTNKSVMAINDSFGIHAALDPHLRQAPGLIPEVSIQDDRINPYPSRAILMIVILAFLGWTIWLLLRPEKPEDH
ncbi:MAG TPA: hypothetical protein DIS96_11795 [Pusillimonas sp.]|nr:hypothetical protein [Pusillimonas sp.]